MHPVGVPGDKSPEAKRSPRFAPPAQSINLPSSIAVPSCTHTKVWNGFRLERPALIVLKFPSSNHVLRLPQFSCDALQPAAPAEGRRMGDAGVVAAEIARGGGIGERDCRDERDQSAGEVGRVS